VKVPVVEAPAELSGMLRLLYGAARITEVESQIVGEPENEDAEELEALSRQYGLASKVMALVAVVERESDRPGELPQTQVVPVGLPQDLELGAYFGEAASMDELLGNASVLQLAAPSATAARFGARARGVYFASELPKSPTYGRAADDEEDQLLEDASRLEADGGMPGASLEERVTRSLDLLERLVEHGSTRARGPFRHHMRRLLEFLEDVQLTDEQTDRLEQLIDRAE
jgi:hypothetical protein